MTYLTKPSEPKPSEPKSSEPLVRSNNKNASLEIKTVDELNKVALLFSQSGYFKDSTALAQCAVKVMAGIELGLGAFQSMSGIHTIAGRPVVGAGLMASRLKSNGKYDYEVVELSDQVCKIAVYELEEKASIKALKRAALNKEITQEQYEQKLMVVSLGMSSFSVEDAKKAGTQNIGKFPRNMLFARCISNAVKWYAPDLFGCSVYVPEEMETGGATDYPLTPRIVEIESLEDESPHSLPPSSSEENEQRTSLSGIIKIQMKERGLSKEQVQGILKQQCGKVSGADATIEELEALIHYIDELPFAG